MGDVLAVKMHVQPKDILVHGGKVSSSLIGTGGWLLAVDRNQLLVNQNTSVARAYRRSAAQHEHRQHDPTPGSVNFSPTLPPVIMGSLGVGVYSLLLLLYPLGNVTTVPTLGPKIPSRIRNSTVFTIFVVSVTWSHHSTFPSGPSFSPV